MNKLFLWLSIVSVLVAGNTGVFLFRYSQQWQSEKAVLDQALAEVKSQNASLSRSIMQLQNEFKEADVKKTSQLERLRQKLLDLDLEVFEYVTVSKSAAENLKDVSIAVSESPSGGVTVLVSKIRRLDKDLYEKTNSLFSESSKTWEEIRFIENFKLVSLKKQINSVVDEVVGRSRDYSHSRIDNIAEALGLSDNSVYSVGGAVIQDISEIKRATRIPYFYVQRPEIIDWGRGPYSPRTFTPGEAARVVGFNFKPNELVTITHLQDWVKPLSVKVDSYGTLEALIPMPPTSIAFPPDISSDSRLVFIQVETDRGKISPTNTARLIKPASNK